MASPPSITEFAFNRRNVTVIDFFTVATLQRIKNCAVQGTGWNWSRVYNVRKCQSLDLSSHATALQAEVMTITACVRATMRAASNIMPIRTMTDSQPALRALESTGGT